MEITEKLLNISPYCRSGEKQNSIQYIVVHWVANPGSSALGNRNYFNSLATSHKTSASSHYIIGLNGEIIKCIPEDEVAFHSGSYSMNRKSIGIENCHPDWEGKFNDNTYNSLVELCAELCIKYEIPVYNIIRHYDVTEKECPKYYVKNEGQWEIFKKDVYNKITGQNVEPIVINENRGDEVPMYKFKNRKDSGANICRL